MRASELLPEVAATIRPPRRQLLSEWADAYRKLSSEASAQPGAWRSFPFQREPLDALSPHSPYERVVLVWASQMGKTEMLLCLIACIIAEQPGPILAVQPTLAMAEAFSKDRLAPMFRDMDILKSRVAAPKARDAGSTIFHRRFVGGHLTIVGSNSPSGLASRPIRYLLMDEVDRWEASAGSEGDPAALAIARTRAFSWSRKIVMVSSPTVKGASRIEQAWLESDQREYFVPCPHCGRHQLLTWKRIEWPEGRPREAQYRCAKCDRLIPHHRKAWMVANGVWVIGNAGSRIAGFRLSELVSPWRDWGALAEDWLQSQGSIERLRTFINTSLAEWWDDQASGSVTEQELLARRENYGPTLPERAAILTAGVDVQDDRVEVSVYAWGKGEESWLMEHRILPGDPSTPGLWTALDEYLLRQWQHPWAGAMPIHAACVDSGGHFTEAVCRFCDERRGRRVWAIKGRAGPIPVWPRRQSKAAKGRVYVIGVDTIKEALSHRLKIADGPGAVHLPATVNERLAEQLCSEYLRTEYRRGAPVRIWERRRGRAAEAWDCAVYAAAALHGLMTHGVSVDAEAERIALLRSGAPPQVGAYQLARSRFVTGQ